MPSRGGCWTPWRATSFRPRIARESGFLLFATFALFWTATRCRARGLWETLAQREAQEGAMRNPKWSPGRQRPLLFPVAGQEARLSVEARRRCRELLVQLLRMVLQAERGPRRDADD